MSKGMTLKRGRANQSRDSQGKCAIAARCMIRPIPGIPANGLGWLPELPTGFPRRNPGPGWPRTHTVTGQNDGAFNSTAWVGNSLQRSSTGVATVLRGRTSAAVRHPELRLNRRARRAARPARLTRSAAPRMPLQPAAAPQRAGSRPRRHWLRSGQQGPSSVQFRPTLPSARLPTSRWGGTARCGQSIRAARHISTTRPNSSGNCKGKGSARQR